jgi:hypothetical protein
LFCRRHDRSAARKIHELIGFFALLAIMASLPSAAMAQLSMVPREFHRNLALVIASHDSDVINAAYGKQLDNRRPDGDFFHYPRRPVRKPASSLSAIQK